MEVTCTICKHYSRTMEQHDRHIQSEAHKTNAEIYEMGFVAGKLESAATIARLRGLLDKIHNSGAFLVVPSHEEANDLLDAIRRELRSGSESEEE